MEMWYLWLKCHRSGNGVREKGGVGVFKNSPNLYSTCFNQDLRFEELRHFKQFDFP